METQTQNLDEMLDRDRPPTKREQRAASIEALLGKALTLFITQGYHATTVEVIAQAAGLTKGAVYFYFKSKANVLKTLLDRTEELTVEPTLAAMKAAGDDPKDRLNAFVRSQSVIGAEKTEYMLLAILMSAEFNGSGDEIEQRLIELMARMENALRETVRSGQENGVFRRGSAPTSLPASSWQPTRDATWSGTCGAATLEARILRAHLEISYSMGWRRPRSARIVALVYQ